MNEAGVAVRCHACAAGVTLAGDQATSLVQLSRFLAEHSACSSAPAIPRQAVDGAVDALPSQRPSASDVFELNVPPRTKIAPVVVALHAGGWVLTGTLPRSDGTVTLLLRLAGEPSITLPTTTSVLARRT